MRASSLKSTASPLVIARMTTPPPPRHISLRDVLEDMARHMREISAAAQQHIDEFEAKVAELRRLQIPEGRS